MNSKHQGDVNVVSHCWYFSFVVKLEFTHFILFRSKLYDGDCFDKNFTSNDGLYLLPLVQFYFFR